MKLPFERHHHPDYTPQEVDQAYETKGWGVKVDRRIPRPDGGEPLYFQLRLPNGTAWTDIADLAAAPGGDAKSTDEAAENGHMFADQTEALRALGEAPGVVLVGSVAEEATPTEPYHTLTVLYTPLTSLPKSLTLSEPEGWTIFQHEQTRVSKHVLRDFLLMGLHQESVENAEIVVTQQYAMATDLGSLLMTFTNTKSASGRTTAYYDSVSRTAYLGEQPAGITDAIT